jgi:carbon-monoxide dehydrogenase small subunit
MQISLVVNGTATQADVEPRLLLVDFLRDTLGLTGTKLGCETGQCGACTILVDGTAVKSCMMLAVQAADFTVTTIEGLAPDGQLTALQQAFWERHGLQCGYCTPAMVLALTDLLDRNPNPAEAEIRTHIDGILCRCTGYQKVVEAVQYAVKQAGEGLRV